MIECDDMKAAYAALVNFGLHIDAVIVGSRKLDVSYPLSAIMATNNDWPSFFRVHPLLEWDVENVWTFILKNKISYCRLYNEGYTSIGLKTDTRKNLLLLNPDGTYRPSYALLDRSKERHGRV